MIKELYVDLEADQIGKALALPDNRIEELKVIVTKISNQFFDDPEFEFPAMLEEVRRLSVNLQESTYLLTKINFELGREFGAVEERIKLSNQAKDLMNFLFNGGADEE